ncbi:MAG: diguanylate cyclase [Deltaproteobacteria bacterium]|nr:diguanylate cyclase [Deltaproteobacteria bacterium]
MTIADLSGFSQAFEREIARSRRGNYPLCALCVDLVSASDALIDRVESALDSAARSSDVAMRSSTEEFVVLLPETTSEGAEILARRLQETLVESLWNPSESAITVGFAQFVPSMEGSALLLAAREAVVQARAFDFDARHSAR